MASTGEVACLGDDFEEAFLKALLSVGYRLPDPRVLLSTGPVEDKAAFLESSRTLAAPGRDPVRDAGHRRRSCAAHGIDDHRAALAPDSREPQRPRVSHGKRIDLVINIPKNYQEEELTNDYLIRRSTVDFGIPLITDIQLAQRFVEAIDRKGIDDLQVKSWADYRHDAR